MVRDYMQNGQTDKVQAIIDELTKDFAYAVTHPNYRNGGLIGLAAVAVALGQVELAKYLDYIVPPILSCFGDADSRVRYYACESLYNVAKVAKGEILLYFNEIFDVLCKLISDPDETVRTGADLVDRLIKDIVAEKAATYTFLISRDKPEVAPSIIESADGTSPAIQNAPPQEANSFSLKNFIPVLVERLYVINPSTRMFLVQWIVLLDSIPDLELVSFLPEFLPGLLQFLSDSTKEVRVATKAALDGLLKDLIIVAKMHTESADSPSPSPNLADTSTDTVSYAAGLYIVGQDTFIDYSRIMTIVLDSLDSPHEEIRFVALSWLNAFLEISPSDVRANIPRIITVLLPTLSDTNPEIRDSGKDLSALLLKYISGLDKKELDSVSIAPAINALTFQFLNEQEVTRLACLDWLIVLLSISGQEPSTSAVNAMLKLLGDPSDAVVAKDIEVVVEILQHASDQKYTQYFTKLIGQFQIDRKLLAQRGKYVVSQLCQLMDPEKIYRTLSIILRDDKDKDFVSLLVQNATNILLLSPELSSVRLTLRSLHTTQGSSLFVSLFKTWSYNGVAAFSLCLLAQAYEHAFAVLRIIASDDISVAMLVQIDRLVQLIESPVFAQMRLQLLEPQTYPFLYKCLYGLLMVLPQSSAFTTLQNRLQSVAAIGTLSIPKPAPTNILRSSIHIDWADLLEWFRKVQGKK